MQQYKVTGQRAHLNLIMIKRSAALANKELKAIESDKADAIVKACDLELILSKGLMTKDELDKAFSKDNILGFK